MSYAKERETYNKRRLVMFDTSKALKRLAATTKKFNIVMRSDNDVALVLTAIADNLMLQLDRSADLK